MLTKLSFSLIKYYYDSLLSVRQSTGVTDTVQCSEIRWLGARAQVPAIGAGCLP